MHCLLRYVFQKVTSILCIWFKFVNFSKTTRIKCILQYLSQKALLFNKKITVENQLLHKGLNLKTQKERIKIIKSFLRKHLVCIKRVAIFCCLFASATCSFHLLIELNSANISVCQFKQPLKTHASSWFLLMYYQSALLFKILKLKVLLFIENEGFQLGDFRYNSRVFTCFLCNQLEVTANHHSA